MYRQLTIIQRIRFKGWIKHPETRPKCFDIISHRYFDGLNALWMLNGFECAVNQFFYIIPSNKISTTMAQLNMIAEAADSYSRKEWGELGTTSNSASYAGFKAGAEWQKEQDKQLLVFLKAIAQWPGNLSDKVLQTATGPNDAALRGGYSRRSNSSI